MHHIAAWLSVQSRPLVNIHGSSTLLPVVTKANPNIAVLVRLCYNSQSDPTTSMEFHGCLAQEADALALLSIVGPGYIFVFWYCSFP